MSNSSDQRLHNNLRDICNESLVITSACFNCSVNDNNDNNNSTELFLSGWPHYHDNGPVYWSFDLLIVVLGITGNILQFILMNDQQVSFLSYSVYLRFLSVTDSLLLITALFESTEEVFKLPVVVNVNSAVCKILNAFSFFVKVVSPWLVVGFTVDRFVCVTLPLSRHVVCNRRTASVICLSTNLLCLVLVLPVLVDVTLQNDECVPDSGLVYYLISIRLLISSTLPCVFILFLNVLIIVRVKRSQKFRNSFARSGLTFSKAEEDGCSRALIIISLLAFFTLVPIAIAECVDGVLKLTKVNEDAQEIGQKLWPLWNMVYMLNFGQNFYILVASAAKYREIVKKKFECFASLTTERRRSLTEISPSVLNMNQMRATGDISLSEFS